MHEPDVNLPKEYVPTPEELEGDSYGHCYMTDGFAAPLFVPKEPHDYSQ